MSVVEWTCFSGQQASTCIAFHDPLLYLIFLRSVKSRVFCVNPSVPGQSSVEGTWSGWFCRSLVGVTEHRNVNVTFLNCFTWHWLLLWIYLWLSSPGGFNHGAGSESSFLLSMEHRICQWSLLGLWNTFYIDLCGVSCHNLLSCFVQVQIYQMEI